MINFASKDGAQALLHTPGNKDSGDVDIETKKPINNNNMEIEGRIIMDLPEEGGTSKAGNVWRKKSYVLETLGQYPRKAKFDIFGDRIDSMRIELGKTYKVSVDVESREFNGRWYTDLRAFMAQETGAVPPVQPQQPQQFGAPAAAPAANDPFGAAPAADPFATSDTDDLPF